MDLIANASVFIRLRIHMCKKILCIAASVTFCQCLSKYSYQSIYCLKEGRFFGWEHAHDRTGTQSRAHKSSKLFFEYPTWHSFCVRPS